MSDDPLLEQVQQSIQQFDAVPLAESARRAYRIAVACGDADDAYRLVLTLSGSRSAAEQQRLKAGLYGDVSSDSAEQRMRQCVEEYIIREDAQPSP